MRGFRLVFWGGVFDLLDYFVLLELVYDCFSNTVLYAEVFHLVLEYVLIV